MAKIQGDQEICRNLLTRSLSLGNTTTTTSASTLTLNAFSTSTQIFTGSTAGQVVNLGDTTTYPNEGWTYVFINDSTQNITIENDGGATQLTIDPGCGAIFTLEDNSTADGIWRYLSICDRDVMDAEGKLLQFGYFGTGTTKNKWLNVSHPSQPSDSTPHVVPWAGEIVGLSYGNENDNSDVDIEIYINGALAYTWDVRNKRTAWIVDSTGIASVSQGDRISMFLRDAGNPDPKDPYGEVIVQVSTMPNGEGGTASGV